MSLIIIPNGKEAGPGKAGKHHPSNWAGRTDHDLSILIAAGLLILLFSNK